MGRRRFIVGVALLGMRVGFVYFSCKLLGNDAGFGGARGDAVGSSNPWQRLEMQP